MVPPTSRRVFLLMGGAAAVTAAGAARRGGLPSAGRRESAVPAATSSASTELLTASVPHTTPSPSPTSTAAARRTTSSIKEYLTDRPGKGSVAALDLVTAHSVTYRGTREFITASIVKVDILIALLFAAQKDGRSLTRSEKSLTRSMITRSDNDAASTLWNTIGGARGLNRVNARLGLTGTHAGTGGYWGHTRTTASDQLRLLRVLAGSTSSLTRARRSYALDLMRDVVADQRWGVSAIAADTKAAALKNGWLASATDDGLWTVHSIGRVVPANGNPVLLAVLTCGSPNRKTGIATVQQLARLAVGGL
ncbi:MAG: hypothetical protein QG608_783 [Actinomycetota bacterium]|nr:hypothetical protein [Actinomycetota bacterium]